MPLDSFNLYDQHFPCSSLLFLATGWRSDSLPSAMPKAQTKVFSSLSICGFLPLSYAFIGRMTNSIALLAVVQGNRPNNLVLQMQLKTIHFMIPYPPPKKNPN